MEGGKEGQIVAETQGVLLGGWEQERTEKKILLDACVERSTRLSDSCLVSRCVTLSKAACQFPNTLSLAAYQEAGERGVS